MTFRLRRRDGTAYSGHIQLTLLEGVQGKSGSEKTRARVSVARSLDAPYLVEGLAPGTYTALALMPTFASDGGERFIVLDVRDGEETIVNAVVAD